MRTVIFTIFLSTIFLIHINSFSQTTVDTVVASVNGDPITLVDLKVYMSIILDKDNWGGLTEEDKQKILSEVINRKVLFLEADKMGISTDAREIEASIDEVTQNRRITRKELEEELSERGISWEKYIDEIKYQIIKEKIFQRVIFPKIEGDAEEILAYYNQNRDKFKKRESAHLYHIMFPFNEKEPERAHKKAISFSKQINSGMNFIDLAKKYTGANLSDIDIGIVHRGDLLPDFDRAVFSTPEGKSTPPLRSQKGYHVFFVVKKTGGEPKPFEEALPEVRELYYRENSDKLYEEWLTKVKSKYVLKILDTGAL